MSIDYYKILEVPKTATDDEIKKAYRKLALKWHPDRCKDSSAKKKFQDISNAYAILSDKQKRENYDKFGSPDGPPSMGMGAGNGPGHSFSFSTSTGGAFNVNPDRLFEEFFGSNFSGFGGPQPGHHVSRPQSVTDINCTLEEIYNGCTKKFKITLDGQQETVEINIKPGTAPGHRYQRKNCIFKVNYKPHKVFTCIKGDLHYHVNLDLKDYINGFSIIIEHLDGKKKKISNHYGDTVIGSDPLTMTVPGLGMTTSNDLIVHFKVKLPKTLET